MKHNRRKEYLQPVGRWGEREQGILEVAAALFRRDGYQNVTMANVAAEAGLSEGTLYNYFRDRHDLVMRVSMVAFEDHALEAEKIVAAAESLHQGLARMIALQIRILLEGKEIYRIWMREVRGAEDYRDLPVRATLRRYSTPMIHLLRKYCTPDQVSPGLDFGTMRDLIFGGVENLVLTAVVQQREKTLDVDALSADLASAYLRVFSLELASRGSGIADGETPRAVKRGGKRLRAS